MEKVEIRFIVSSDGEKVQTAYEMSEGATVDSLDAIFATARLSIYRYLTDKTGFLDNA